MVESDFWEKFPEICRKSPFLQILFGLFPYIALFFHLKTLLITMLAIKHGSFVNKTYFCSRNFLKITGTVNFHRKTVFLEFLELYLIFFHVNLHTDRKRSCLKCDAAKYAGKTSFFAFPQDLIITARFNHYNTLRIVLRGKKELFFLWNLFAFLYSLAYRVNLRKWGNYTR